VPPDGVVGLKEFRLLSPLCNVAREGLAGVENIDDDKGNDCMSI
jgi:hypothetical protein